MLDIKLLRDNPDKVKDGIAAKNADPKLVDEFLRLDKEWREITAKLDEKRAEQNKLSGPSTSSGDNREAAKRNKEEGFLIEEKNQEDLGEVEFEE